jgi:hypothetical protein
MVTKLDEYEIKVLRICAGQAVPDMHWGGAMGQALNGRRTAKQLHEGVLERYL